VPICPLLHFPHPIFDRTALTTPANSINPSPLKMGGK